MSTVEGAVRRHRRPWGAVVGALAGWLAANAPAGFVVVASAQTPELLVQTGHSGAVNSLAASHDGQWLASGSADRSVRLWHLGSGRELRKPAGPSPRRHGGGVERRRHAARERGLRRRDPLVGALHGTPGVDLRGTRGIRHRSGLQPRWADPRQQRHGQVIEAVAPCDGPVAATRRGFRRVRRRTRLQPGRPPPRDGRRGSEPAPLEHHGLARTAPAARWQRCSQRHRVQPGWAPGGLWQRRHVGRRWQHRPPVRRDRGPRAAQAEGGDPLCVRRVFQRGRPDAGGRQRRRVGATGRCRERPLAASARRTCGRGQVAALPGQRSARKRRVRRADPSLGQRRGSDAAGTRRRHEPPERNRRQQ